jgi:hypothetical protein
MNYVKLKQQFDEILAKKTKEEFKAWIKMDNERLNNEKFKNNESNI